MIIFLIIRECYQVGAKVIVVLHCWMLPIDKSHLFKNKLRINVIMLYIILMHVSLSLSFFFFDNDITCCVFYILDYGNNVGKKSNWSDFLIWVQKWVIKQWRKIEGSTMQLAQELLMNLQGQWWFKKFCKGNKSLEDEGHQKLAKTNWEHHQSWSSYNNIRSCQRTKCQTFYGCLAFESNVQSLSSVQLCDPMNWSMPGFSVLYYLAEFAQTHVHCVGNAIQPSHPLSPSPPPVLSLSQQQGLFQCIDSLHHVAKLLELQLNHQPFQWIFRVDFL